LRAFDLSARENYTKIIDDNPTKNSGENAYKNIFDEQTNKFNERRQLNTRTNYFLRAPSLPHLILWNTYLRTIIHRYYSVIIIGTSFGRSSRLGRHSSAFDIHRTAAASVHTGCQVFSAPYTRLHTHTHTHTHLYV